METQKSLLFRLAETIEQYHTEQHARKPEAEVALSKRAGRAGRLVRWLLPNGGTLILIALLIATQSVWARNLQSPAVPGPSATTVNYQGRLANSGGTSLSGTYAMAFAIYDAASGGNLIWGPETHAAIPVSSGLFSVGLGSQTSGGIPTTVWNGDRYLEITVGGETLSPRELIRSVPIAGMAITVPDNAIGTTKVADGAITQSKLGDNSLIRTLGSSQAKVQYGLAYYASATCDYVTVNFPQPFSQTPTVVVTQNEGTHGYGNYVVSAVTTTGFRVVKYGATNCDTIGYANWIAIGQ